MHPIVRRLLALDEALAEKGFPRLSPWWRATLTRFYESRKRQLVLRAGRRAGKSSSLCRVAVCEALYGEHKVPPGDLGVVSFVSVSMKEAMARLRTIRTILDALGVKYRPMTGGGGIQLVGRPVAFVVFAATVAGVSGFTCICGIGDEVAKWRDADTGANPATEVLASWRPTMATQPNAHMFLSSSPVGRLDAHATAVDEGDTRTQMVECAPTWVANPTVTEEETHDLEPDIELWRREYAAIPLEGGEHSIFSPALLDPVTRGPKSARIGPLVIPPEPGAFYTAAIDPATRGNAWTLGIAREIEQPGDDDRSLTQVVFTREWRGSKSAPLDPDDTFAQVAADLKPYGLRSAWSDQHAIDFVAAVARRHEVDIEIETITAAKKLIIYEGLRARAADKLIEIPADPVVRGDLMSVRKWVTRNGLSIELQLTPDGRHADYAAMLGLLVLKSSGSSGDWVNAMRRARARGDIGSTFAA